ncbi:hypothetical protein DSECCO2_659110 [anaerobic digester metagenome]
MVAIGGVLNEVAEQSVSGEDVPVTVESAVGQIVGAACMVGFHITVVGGIDEDWVFPGLGDVALGGSEGQGDGDVAVAFGGTGDDAVNGEDSLVRGSPGKTDAVYCGSGNREIGDGLLGNRHRVEGGVDRVGIGVGVSLDGEMEGFGLADVTLFHRGGEGHRYIGGGAVDLPRSGDSILVRGGPGDRGTISAAGG